MPSYLPIATEATAQPRKTPKLRLVDPRAVFDVVFVCVLLLFILLSGFLANALASSCRVAGVAMIWGKAKHCV